MLSFFERPYAFHGFQLYHSIDGRITSWCHGQLETRKDTAKGDNGSSWNIIKLSKEEITLDWQIDGIQGEDVVVPALRKHEPAKEGTQESSPLKMADLKHEATCTCQNEENNSLPL